MNEANPTKEEQIKHQIGYIETNKIPELQKTIDFYQQVGARKDMTDILADMEDLKQTVANMKSLLENGPQKHDGLKVRVTEHNGNLIIETLNFTEFDEDFTPAGQGRIGCSLNNNARLGISEKAIALMKTFKKVGDVIGDLMGEEDSFTWIGGPLRIAQKNSTVCRYFKMPVGYVVIDNKTDEKTIEHIDEKKAGSINIEYEDFEQEIWIELSKSGSWKPKAGKEDSNDHNDKEYVYNDYYTLENSEGARFVGGHVYDPDVKILNAPENMVVRDGESRVVKMSKEIEKEILKTCLNIFGNGETYGWNIKVPDKEIMSYIFPLFDLGFDNNVMNPRDGYWRMSIRATPKVMLEKLKAFKKEEVTT